MVLEVFAGKRWTNASPSMCSEMFNFMGAAGASGTNGKCDDGIQWKIDCSHAWLSASVQVLLIRRVVCLSLLTAKPLSARVRISS